MTIKEAIKVLDDGVWWDYLDKYIHEKDRDELVEAIDTLENAIRTEQEAEKIEPLTLDELRDMDGKPIWAVLEIDGMSQIHDYAIVDSKCECVKGLETVFTKA